MVGLPKPYYQDEWVTIYHDQAEKVLPKLPNASVDLIITDPPYFRIKREWWDRQWDTAEGFLSWLGILCQEWQRILKPNGSIYLFASPEMTTRVEALVRNYFNVLNNIRWVKEDGWHKKADKEELRSYLSPWEGIIFAEQYGDQYEEAATALHKKVYAPLGRYIQTERERAGLTRNEVEVGLGYVSSDDPTRGTALCYRWEEGSSLPTKETYDRLRELLNATAKQNYEYLRRDYEELRRPFTVSNKTAHTDIWAFDVVAPFENKHPCEKPQALIEHIMRASSKPSAMILDCFLGRGTTAQAAINLRRRCIGVDVEAKWCQASVWRISQKIIWLADEFTTEPVLEVS